MLGRYNALCLINDNDNSSAEKIILSLINCRRLMPIFDFSTYMLYVIEGLENIFNDIE
jgi:hypothetical protein